MHWCHRVRTQPTECLTWIEIWILYAWFCVPHPLDIGSKNPKINRLLDRKFGEHQCLKPKNMHKGVIRIFSSPWMYILYQLWTWTHSMSMAQEFQSQSPTSVLPCLYQEIFKFVGKLIREILCPHDSCHSCNISPFSEHQFRMWFHFKILTFLSFQSHATIAI